MTIEEKIVELGYTLPAVPPAVANYLPFVRMGNWVHTAGALCLMEGKLLHTGKVGDAVSLDEGYAAARACALNNLAVLKEACDGDLDRVERIVSVSGFVNAAPDFTDVPKVINGASDFFVQVFGDAGRHARTAVGAAVLPLDSSVETALIAVIKS